MNGSDLDRLIDSEAQTALCVSETPAYVYSERVLRASAERASAIAAFSGCGLIYTLKPCGLAPVLETFAPWIEGFGASSTFEARLASGLLRSDQTLHCYSPALSVSDMASVLSMVDYLSVNSSAQFEQAARLNTSGASLGLRINPELGFADDVRYDPSRPHSKLGVPLSTFSGSLASGGVQDLIEGVHVHNNCESDDLNELLLTAERILGITARLPSLQWVNLGGGYYLGPETDPEPLRAAVEALTRGSGLTVFIEPGTALVQGAGFLVSEILDVFDSNGADVALLDTSTSHLPEAFEYQYTPELAGPTDGGSQRTILAGRSCLAGDILGDYRFTGPVRAGQRVAFLHAGSYSHSRATPFNGIPIPNSYMLKSTGEFELMSAYGYDDFARRNGAVSVATP